MTSAEAVHCGQQARGKKRPMFNSAACKRSDQAERRKRSDADEGWPARARVVELGIPRECVAHKGGSTPRNIAKRRKCMRCRWECSQSRLECFELAAVRSRFWSNRPTTRCYYCQVYGCMAREFFAKSKCKGGAKGGGEGATQREVKGGLKIR